MYTTGMIRRIDDLGRIVIPKEIRKKLRINDGENLEIFVNNEEIILKKYSLMKSIEDFANSFTDAIYSYIKCNVIITNDTSIIACSGPLKKKLLNCKISENLVACVNRKENLYEKYKKNLTFTDNLEEDGTYAISSIISQGTCVGLVILFSNEQIITESEMRICEIASRILSKYLDE